MNILNKIIEHKKEELKKQNFNFSQENLKPSKRSFLKALQNKNKLKPNLIAEIKLSSPSQGIISQENDIAKIAKIYEKSGASAISVLTDKKFFGGEIANLKKISEAVDLPILRKDFILISEQILEARFWGADAILLMVSVLKTVEKLRELIAVADDLQMDCLVEIHSEEELEIALKAGAKIIGVNARDFSDLSINQKIFTELLPKIPGKIIKIAESGMKEKNDILVVSDLADGVLIGTTLMKSGSENIAEKISKLFGE